MRPMIIDRRRWIAHSLQLGAGMALTAATRGLLRAQSRPSGSVAGAASLKAHAAARGLLTGCAVDMRLLRTDPVYRQVLAEQYSILVGENCMKFGPMQPTAERYFFDDADALLAFAETRGMKLRGHNFVWHEALPAWFAGTVTKENARKILTGHILTIAGRYRGKIHSWDVVNEAIWIKDGRPDGLRSSSPWFQMLGPEYLELAFRTARQADPAALLTYNDYGIESGTAEESTKRAAVIGLLRRLKAANVPLDALGVQSHIRAGQDPGFSGWQPGFARGLAELTAAARELRLQLFITEMDVNDDSIDADDPALRDQAVAATYREYLGEALKAPEMKAVLTWGVGDSHTWLNHSAGMRKLHPNREERPLPFGMDYEPMPAFLALRDAFDSAKSR